MTRMRHIKKAGGGFQSMPSPAAECQWLGCGLPTTMGLRDVLVKERSGEGWYRISVVPLCTGPGTPDHLGIARDEKRLIINFHPSEGGPEVGEPGPHTG